MRKSYKVISITLLLLLGSFFVFNSYIYQQKQAKKVENITSYTAALMGEYVCLPHKNSKDIHTLECAFGIKTNSSEYYALDFAALPQASADLQIGDSFTASGVIVPIEMLSTDQWNKYNVKGIFSVTAFVQKLP